MNVKVYFMSCVWTYLLPVALNYPTILDTCNYYKICIIYVEASNENLVIDTGIE